MEELLDHLGLVRLTYRLMQHAEPVRSFVSLLMDDVQLGCKLSRRTGPAHRPIVGRDAVGRPIELVCDVPKLTLDTERPLKPDRCDSEIASSSL